MVDRIENLSADPVSTLRSAVQQLEKAPSRDGWGQFVVNTLAEVETFIMSATGPDGREVAGLLVRPVLRPDMLLMLTEVTPVSQEMATHIIPRLPAPRAATPAPAKRGVRPFRPQPVLPPTAAQANAPSELVEQGRALALDAERRRAAKRGQIFAPGSVQLETKVVNPIPQVPVAGKTDTLIKPDLDEGGIPEG